MNEHQTELYQRIRAFEFSSPEDPRPFERRLAQQEHWTAAFTQRAIDEYRRFALMACTAGHPVCPSEVVDDVWHLHLIYTRSYWQRFCSDVLGQPLHHEPSRGGAAESAKHRQMYADTLASYRAIFGERPPADIWPEVDVRFAGPGATQVVDRSRYWLLPKPRLPRTLSVRSLFWAAAMPVLAVPAFGPLTDLYDLRGPDFLKLYVCVAMLALMAGFVVRAIARRSNAEPMREPPELDPYELAYLAGGTGRAVNAAVGRLVQAGSLSMVQALPPTFKCIDLAPGGMHELEHVVCRAFSASADGDRLRAAHREARPLFPPVKEKLREHGLLVSASSDLIGRSVPLLIMAAVILLAVGKMSVGLERGRPIGLLVLASIVTAGAGLVAFGRPLFRTYYGDNYLGKVRHQYGDLQRGVRSHPEELPAEQLATALGLWGCGLLATTPYGPELQRRDGWAGMYGGGCGGAATGSGCGGGGCGGGGGGCGGGCGGCGG